MGRVLLGAVAYDPKVVTIWDGFRSWLRSFGGIDFDYVLYSNYERQVDDLVDGRIDVAWNSPLAWVRARRLAAARGVPLTPVTMRDTDCDLRSVVVVRADSPVTSLAGLAGRVVATGAVDSPQATLLPLSLLRSAGLSPGDSPDDVRVRRFDIGVGLHGDHIGGEREAARALFAADPAEQVDAACMIDSNLLLFGREGVLPAGAVRVLAQTPPYDHCTMTAGPSAADASGAAGAAADPVERFGELLLGMDYADASLRPLLDLEGLKEWRPPRLSGYDQLERAVDEAGFYDRDGAMTADGYRP
ncbi:MAG TPA: PhnD/SsuA/transferrin family substrate-binding protein [Trebonia sp.]|jgi:ABC-type phosphate/phosphonate transport system substrate-binding protein|nr:PhnD/SsuA/transferrin family substrate-binding protein [Trebonia sp.]